jgi:hypothetical protein
VTGGGAVIGVELMSADPEGNSASKTLWLLTAGSTAGSTAGADVPVDLVDEVEWLVKALVHEAAGLLEDIIPVSNTLVPSSGETVDSLNKIEQ